MGGIWSDWVAPDRRAPDLEPVFGPKAWGASSTCRAVHPNGSIPPGSRCVCMACHKCGVEHDVARHVKLGNGTLREGWDQPEPTRYERPKAGLRGGLGS